MNPLEYAGVELFVSQQRMAKLCNSEKALVRRFGHEQALRIQQRLSELRAATCLEDLRFAPGRCHELIGNRSGEVSIDLHHPYRLIFIATDRKAATRADGGLDWTAVTDVTVIEIIDTHDN
jgi:plasmid maintenance system killer protein